MRPCFALLISLASSLLRNETPQPLDPNAVPLPPAAPKQTSAPTRPVSAVVTWEGVSELLKYRAIFDQCMRERLSGAN
jgi:hypothetical protein